MKKRTIVMLVAPIATVLAVAGGSAAVAGVSGHERTADHVATAASTAARHVDDGVERQTREAEHAGTAEAGDHGDDVTRSGVAGAAAAHLGEESRTGAIGASGSAGSATHDHATGEHEAQDDSDQRDPGHGGDS